MASSSGRRFPHPNPNVVFLELICANSSYDDIEMALKARGVNVNYRNDDGETALHLAIEQENKKIVELLLDHFAKIDIPNANGATVMDVLNDKLQHNTNDDNLMQIKYLLENFEIYYANGLMQTLHGNMFQVKLFMLIHLRAMEIGYKPSQAPCSYRLSSDWNAAGLFDDVCLEREYEDKLTGLLEKMFHLYQAKHKLYVDKSEIDIYDLFYSKEFNILKYFESFIGVKNDRHFENKRLQFCLVTNTHFEQSLLTRQTHEQILQVEDITDDDLLYSKLDSFKAIKYKLCDNLELSNPMQLSLIDCALKSKHLNKFPGAKTYLEFKRQVIGYQNETQKIQYARNECFGAQQKNKREIKKIIEKVLSLGLHNNKNKRDEYLKNLRSIATATKQPEEIAREMLQFFDGRAQAIPNESQKAETNLAAHLNTNGMPPIDWNILPKLKEKRSQIAKNETNLQTIVHEINLNPKIIDNVLSVNLSNAIKDKIQNCCDLEEIKQELDKELGQSILEVALIVAAIDDSKFRRYKNDFFNEFRIVCDFPNEEQIDDLIGSKLRKTFNLLDTKLVTASYFVKTLNFLKRKCKHPHFWTNQLNFCNEIENQMNSMQILGSTKEYVEKIECLGVCFQKTSLVLNSLNEFLSEQNVAKQVFYLFTKAPKTSALKILQIFKKHPIYVKQDAYIFKDSESLSHQAIQKRHLNAFANEGCHDLLVVEVLENKLSDEFCEKIEDILKQSRELNGIDGTIPPPPKRINYDHETRMKKIILIKKGSVAEYRFENLEFDSNKFECYHEDDTDICFEHLAPSSQTKLLQRNVNFQGNESKLNEIIDENCARQIFTETNHLTRLFDNREFCIGNMNAFRSHAYVEDYYICREFHRQKVTTEVFKIKNQSFFITGITKENLNSFGVSNERILKWHDKIIDDKMRIQSKNVVILFHSENGQEASAQAFQKLDGNILWLEFIESRQIFLWMGCKGQIKQEFIQQIDKNYVPIEHCELFKENYFCNENGSAQKAVLIANDAGMGKSLMLINLANKLNGLKSGANNGGNHRNHDKWIVRINLNDFARKKSPNLNEVNKTGNVIDFFVTKLAISSEKNVDIENVDIEIQQKLLKCCLENENVFKKPKIVIMLDGFDEVCPDYRDMTTRLIKALKDTEVAQIYVTTRVHEKNHLERELESSAFNLNPWNENYQIEFLHKFWKWSLKYVNDPHNGQIKAKSYEEIRDYLARVNDSPPEDYKDELVASFATLLNKFPPEKSDRNIERIRAAIDKELQFTKFIDKFLGKWNHSINDRDKKFVSIPLLLRILSEIIIYRMFTLPTDQGLSSLYDDFVEIKFEIFSREKAENTQGKPSVNSYEKSLRKEMHKTHNALAVRLFFSEYTDLPKLDNLDDIYDEMNPDNAKEEMERLAGLGIVTLNGDRLEFIHRSFAEYFLSRYLIDNVYDERVQVLLIDKIISSGDYQLICKFFNDQLKCATRLMNEAVLMFKSKAKKVFFMKNEALIKSIVDGECDSICKFLLKGIRHDKALHRIIMTSDCSLGVNILELSIANCEIFDVLLKEIHFFDDETLKKERFKVEMAIKGILNNTIGNMQVHNVIDRLIGIVKNERRLGDEFLKGLLKYNTCFQGNLLWAIDSNEPFSPDDVSKIEKILVQVQPYPVVHRDLLLQVDCSARNIFSTIIDRFNKNVNHNDSVENAKKIVQKLIENIDESDEKYFEDLAIISTANISTESIEKLLEIVNLNSIFHKKLRDVMNIDIEMQKKNLIDAIEKGDRDSVKTILKHESFVKKSVLLNDGKTTALNLAVFAPTNRSAIIREIFDNLQNEHEFRRQLLLWPPDKNGNTVLHLAAENGYTDVVGLLLENSSGDPNLLKELILLKSRKYKISDIDFNATIENKTALELAYENKHLETFATIFKCIVENRFEFIDDLVGQFGGVQTALESFEYSAMFPDFFNRILSSNAQYQQIYSLFNAIKGNGTNIKHFLNEIGNNDDTMKKLLLSKDLEGNSFFVLSIQKPIGNVSIFLRDFLKAHFYFGYEYLTVKALHEQTPDVKVAIFNWMKTHLQMEYSIPSENMLTHVACTQIEIAHSSNRFDHFWQILMWTNDNCNDQIFKSFLKRYPAFMVYIALNWDNSNAARAMEAILDILEDRQQILDRMFSNYDTFKYIFNSIPNDCEDKRFMISKRLKSIFDEIANFLLQSNAISSTEPIYIARSQLKIVEHFVEEFYADGDDKKTILTKIEEMRKLNWEKWYF